jgi:hypothetical protein
MRTAADQNSLLIQQTFPLSTQNYKFGFTETTEIWEVNFNVATFGFTV